MLDIHIFNFSGIETRVFFCNTDEVLEDALLVFDENTSKLFPERSHRNSLVLPSGEETKNWTSIDKIVNSAMENSFGRDGCLCAIGGGVICDMTAFAASIYMRGCSVILVPTTLLSMVDASLGGKTGIDYNGHKNMVGTFYPASEVRICTEFLVDLPEREFISGLGEVIKTAMLGDEYLFDFLIENKDLILKRDLKILKEIINRCIIVKGRIVENDFREKGLRMTLNLGHTFAHALESVTHFKTWSHGEAVAWGLYMAMETGLKLGLTNENYAMNVIKLLELYEFPLYMNEDSGKLIEAMDHDKKKSNGMVNFVLQRGINDTLVTPIEKDILLLVLNENCNKAGKM